MPVTVGGDRGLPLISRLVTEASLRRESRNAKRRPVVVKTRKTRSAILSTVLGPVWKWLVDKNTELNPWTPFENPSRTLS